MDREFMMLVRGMFVRVGLVRTRVVWRLMAPIRSFFFRRKRIGAFIQRVLDRFPALQDALFELARGDSRKRYRTWAAAYDTIDDADLSAMREEQSRFAEPPLLSLVVPVAQRSEGMLEVLAESLLAQVYARWELYIVGEPPLGEGVTAFIAQALSRDPRFIRPPAERAASLADAWNAALRSAGGEFAILVDPCVLLRPHSLFLFARTIEHHPNAVLIYADDDLIDEEGTRSGHYFKPDWNEAFLCSQNYLGGLVAFHRSLALAAGGCHDDLDGDCAWGLFLRMTAGAPPGTIHHLPFILSHRRAGKLAPAARDVTEREAAARALEERLADLGKRADVEPVGDSSYRTSYPLPEKPRSVSVIVPSTCRLEFLRPCMEGLLTRTSYPDLEVLIAANEIAKDLPEQRDYLEAVAAEPQVRVLFYEDRPYNFSWVNNWAVGQARGELLCFLNDDTDVIGRGWLSAMVARAIQDGVGAVGAMLFYPNDRIQHAGVLLGAGGIAAHTYGGSPRGIGGYHDRALVDQDISCVTAACMLVRRNVFLNVEGFDEALGIAYNDVDFCLRLRAAGWRIVWTPSAELYHRESVSIGRHYTGEREQQWSFESNLIRSRWSEELISDPHHNPNLSLDPLQLWEPAFPPRVSYPWRAGLRVREADARAAASAGRR
jgi:GT2 family glycosyltransferase